MILSRCYYKSSFHADLGFQFLIFTLKSIRNAVVFWVYAVRLYSIALHFNIAFMILNHKQDVALNPICITLGKEKINAGPTAKLLGVHLDCNKNWRTQIQGIGGTISNLNSRLYLLRRLQMVISKDRLRRIGDSLYTSKIRYGVQLYGKVRLNENDPTDTLLDSLQIAQNKYARFIHGSNLMDRIIKINWN